MKKILLFLAILGALFLIAGTAQAAEVYGETSTQTGSAIISTQAGVIGGLIIATDATNAVTLTVYDGTSAGGTKLTPTMVITTSATDRLRGVSLDLAYKNGIYVAATSSGAIEYTVYFRSR